MGNRWCREAVFATGMALAALHTLPAMAQGAASPADIQWAQEMLKAKGYDIGGRASPKMTDGARRALSSYQKQRGLAPTGELDASTLAAMIAERQGDRGKVNDVGSLGGGAKPGTGTTNRTATREAPPQPKAVPTTRLDRAGEEGASLGSVVLGQPGAASVRSSADTGPAPVAAPRAEMSVSGDTAANGQADGGAFGFKPANWMRYGVAGVLAGTLAWLGFGWWRSGRKRLPEPDYETGNHHGADFRREPVFGTLAREELHAGPPPLAAPARLRR